MINDFYLDLSAKSSTRKQRGETTQEVHIEGFDQHMPLGLKWREFLKHSGNKEGLTEVICKYFKDGPGRKSLKSSFTVTSKGKIYTISKSGVTEVKCDHEEADTMLVLMAYLLKKDAIIVSKDTDVLVLLIWAYNHYQIKDIWILKYDAEKYVDIGAICEALCSVICEALPSFHAITGCDTTSYLYRVGKVTAFKKLVANRHKAILLKSLGVEKELTESSISDVKEFIRSVLYAGQPSERYIDTRIRLYRNLKVKSSLPLPPDGFSVIQVIKRAHHQIYYWLRCCDMQFDRLDITNYGWVVDDGNVLPLWYDGPQLPPSVNKGKERKGQKRKLIKQGDIGDDEGSNDDGGHVSGTLKKKKKNVKKNIKKIAPENQKSISEELQQGRSECSKTSFRSGEEGDNDECTQTTPASTEVCTDESDWEVSDFLSSDDSCDEWLP